MASPTPTTARRLPRALLALLALLTLTPVAAAASTTYVDRRHGFSIKLPGREWSQTPTQPGEETEVAKFKDDRQGDFATLSIYRFGAAPAAETTPSGTEGGPTAPEPGQVPRAPYGRQEPKDAESYLRYVAEWLHRRYGLEFAGLPEAKTVKVGKDEGRVLTLEVESPEWRGHRDSVVAGIVAKNGEEYLVLFTSPEKVAKVEKDFVRSIRSFRFKGDAPEADDEEDDPEARGKAVVEEAQLLDPEKRARIKKDLVGTWQFIDTPHYIVIYNCDRPLAAAIAKRVESMREKAYEVVFPPVKPIESCMVVRVCKEMDEYHHYGGPPGSAGYWNSGTDELVFPDLSRSKKADETTIGVLHHEGFHQYVYYALLRHDPPVWFNEGYAEYFFCANPDGKKLTFEKRHPMRYSVVKSALGTGELVPIRDFVKMSQMEYYRKANLCYAQGWAFATWLKNVTKDERWREIPDIFFRELQQGYLQIAPDGGFPGGWRFDPNGMDPVEQAALDKAFEGVDLDALDAAFQADLKKKM